MKKTMRYMLLPAIGAACAALAVGLSRLLVRNLPELFSLIGAWSGLPEDTLVYGSQILTQLKSALILSPWIPALLTGAFLGLPTARFLAHRSAKRIAFVLVLSILLLIPLALLALYFTEVNGIRIGALIQTLLPLLPHLL